MSDPTPTMSSELDVLVGDLADTAQFPQSTAGSTKSVTPLQFPVSTRQAAADTAVATAAAFAALRASFKTPSLSWRDGNNPAKHVVYAANVDAFFTIGTSALQMDKFDASGQRHLATLSAADFVTAGFSLTGAVTMCYCPNSGLILIGRGASGVVMVDPITFQPVASSAADCQSSAIYNPIDGNVYCSDSSGNKIKGLDSTTGAEVSSLTLNGSGVQAPSGKDSLIAIDSLGGVWWAGANSSQSRISSIAGGTTMVFRSNANVGASGALAIGYQDKFYIFGTTANPGLCLVYDKLGNFIKPMQVGPVDGDCYVCYDPTTNFLYFSLPGWRNS